MKKAVLLSFTLVVIGFYVASVGPNREAKAQGKRKTPDGKALYQAQCAKCHGDDGKGIESIPDIPDLSTAKWQASRTDKEITEAINNGIGIMPGFQETFSAAEIRAVVKQVRSLGPATTKTKK
jgi:cytochrome c oxidase cbb3-type subunit 3